MITLHRYNVSAEIYDRYATTVYSFDFENVNQNGSNELKFEITIDADAFISSFTANIDGQIFIGKTKEKQTAAKEYKQAKEKDENTILISQPHKDIANVFEIKTNIDSKSKITLNITIEQYLKKIFNFNELTIQILRNFKKYNIKPNYNHIGFIFDVYDISGIYDISIPSSEAAVIIDEQSSDKLNKNYKFKGRIKSKCDTAQSLADWRENLKIGDKIEVEDPYRKWYEAEIIESDDTYFKIHYIDWDSKWDEKIFKTSKRICKLGTHLMTISTINEIKIKYKIKGESQNSYILFDNNSNTFCHVISNIFKQQSMDIMDEKNEGQVENEGGSTDNVLIPRRVIFVIDKSASMGGSRWKKTANATIEALKQLRDGYDRFNIILFNNDIDKLFDNENKMVLVNKENINKSIEYIKDVKTGNGTNIDKPLKEAINIIKQDCKDEKEKNNNNFFINQIIFITDGEVDNTKKILLNVNKLNDLSDIDKYNKKISIYTFGVGQDGNDSDWIKDLNHSFLKLLAINNNAFYKRIKQAQIDEKLKEYFNILSNPILTNIKIEYNNKNIKQLTNTKFNTLYNGNDIIIAGKIENIHDNNDNISATITAITGKETTDSLVKPIEISKTIQVNIDINGAENKNTERIWAYLKLQQLSKQKIQKPFNDMIEMDDDEKKEESALGLSLGLKYKFVTPWTSMIVVKEKQNDDKDEDEQQENQNVKIFKEEDYSNVDEEFTEQNDDEGGTNKEQTQQTKDDNYSDLKHHSVTRRPGGKRHFLKSLRSANSRSITNHGYEENDDFEEDEVDGSDGLSEFEFNCGLPEYQTMGKNHVIIKPDKQSNDLNDGNEIDTNGRFMVSGITGYGGGSLYKIGRGRRGKKKENDDQDEEKKNNKKSPGLIRVQSDLDELELPEYITINIPNKNDLQRFEVEIMAYDGFWKGIKYKFSFIIGDNYPYKPPKIKIMDQIYHPNIDLNWNNVCLNILTHDWKPCLTIQDIINSLILLFLEPNGNDSINKQAGKLLIKNIDLFKQNVIKSINGQYVDGMQFKKMNI